MINNYVAQIRTRVGIYASKKSSNVFDGSYKSIYQGNGLDFENLREYIPGDSIRDIDWKASSRSGKVLVKRYIAEKKHNIMLVFDSGKNMTAVTKALESKHKVALNAGGTVAYLAGLNGDNVGAIYNRSGLIQYYPLKTGTMNIERILTEYGKEDFEGYMGDIEKSLQYIIRYINRKMIVFVITDDKGMSTVSDDTIKKLTYQHDVLFINISDADITEKNAYSVEKDQYVPDFIADNKELKAMEHQAKKALLEHNEKKLSKYKIVTTQVDSEEDIVDKITELLGGHKHANSR
ncbi:MAG: DUF58 domain-containing protein [Lachnospiraceae bacterium]|nr:DUF58 domain-containing protein [Lachnospiraceae bacterium]